MLLHLIYKPIANPPVPCILKEKIITEGANNLGGLDACSYNILLDLRGISGIVDLIVALKGENGLVVTNSNAKNKDLNHFFSGLNN